jgi:6-phosphogluconolactonase
MEFTVNSDNKPKISIFKDIEEMSVAFFKLFHAEYSLAVTQKKDFHLTLSGGSTPIKLFEYLSVLPLPKMDFRFLHIYWGDERCVPPDNLESNYGNIWNAIIKYFDIPDENIHRIHGEEMPTAESLRYSDILRKNVPLENGMPRFDLILLGIGEDGHTASIFPDAMEKLSSKEFCYVAIHPQSQQKRITLSLGVINNAKNVIFLATGISKAGIVETIARKGMGWKKFPASYVDPVNGMLQWFLDENAGKNL